jgi:hypothetical protein
MCWLPQKPEGAWDTYGTEAVQPRRKAGDGMRRRQRPEGGKVSAFLRAARSQVQRCERKVLLLGAAWPGGSRRHGTLLAR